MRPGRGLSVALMLATIALVACTGGERKDIRLTPTATADPGVRIIVDNCPGPDTVFLSVREEILWQIDVVAAEAGEGVEVTGTATDAALVPTAALLEFQVGQTPAGWDETTTMELPLREGIRYTVGTEPDGKRIDFSVPDLAPGLLFDGQGRRQFNPNLVNEDCEAQADLGEFGRDLAVLGALWLTCAALALVALITVLFVITRRFSRIRSIQRRAARQAELERLVDERERTPV